jgi:hypothetical protein
MTKRVVLLGVISALILSGCGKAAGTQVARPIALGNTAKPTTPIAPALTRATPKPTPTPELVEDETDAEVIEEEETAAEPTPTPTPTPTPVADSDDEDEEEEQEDEEQEEEEATVKANEFVKSIGNGSLNSSHGVAVSGDHLFVVDNARTGLFGKFASVRRYEIASGDYTKLSFENIGNLGAKNMPTTVTAVKIKDGQVLAGNSAIVYTFGLDAKLVSTEEGAVSLTTQVTDPTTGDVFKLAGNEIQRLHAGKVLVSFGDDVIGEANAIAVGPDGSLFVSDKTKGIVHQFAPAAE